MSGNRAIEAIVADAIASEQRRHPFRDPSQRDNEVDATAPTGVEGRDYWRVLAPGLRGKSGYPFCPRCGAFSSSGSITKVRQASCTGERTLFTLRWLCPRRRHVHVACLECGATWLEAPCGEEGGVFR